MRKMFSKFALLPSASPGTIAVLLVSIAAVILVIYLAVGLPGGDREVIEEIIASRETDAPPVNTGQIIDATRGRDVKAEEGYRYKVVIEDESTDGMAGVARIGGLVTFVDNSRVGEQVVIEVTRLKERTAEAVVVERLGWVETAARARDRRPERAERQESGPVRVGETYSGTVDDVGSKGDGIVHVEGKVVFIPDTAIGQQVTFIITEDLGRFATARLVEGAPAETSSVRGEADAGSEAVQAGAEFDVVVEEKDRKDPERNGVARIGGLVVFIPDTQPGDRVRIRIRERQPRFAFAEVLASLDGDAPGENGRTVDQ